MATLIIGARCKDGIVLSADRRVMRGTEYKEEKKLFEFHGVITAIAGLTGIRDKFIELSSRTLAEIRVVNISEVIYGIEDTIKSLYERYKGRVPAGEEAIQALVAGLEGLRGGKGKLYHVGGGGFSEEVDFVCVGHGSPYATALAKFLYAPELTVDKFSKIAIFLSTWVENVDATVGGIPDVVLITDDKGITYLKRSEVQKTREYAKAVMTTVPLLIEKAMEDPNYLKGLESELHR